MELECLHLVLVVLVRVLALLRGQVPQLDRVVRGSARKKRRLVLRSGREATQTDHKDQNETGGTPSSYPLKASSRTGVQDSDMTPCVWLPSLILPCRASARLRRQQTTRATA